jgi:hypothetical protein
MAKINIKTKAQLELEKALLERGLKPGVKPSKKKIKEKK